MKKIASSLSALLLTILLLVPFTASATAASASLSGPGTVRAGDTITLTFVNAGKTIPQEKLDRIFDQFFRLDGARASRTGGAGLGLAIAREIVELHGGTIRAESSHDTVTFTVTLPAS